MTVIVPARCFSIESPREGVHQLIFRAHSLMDRLLMFMEFTSYAIRIIFRGSMIMEFRFNEEVTG